MLLTCLVATQFSVASSRIIIECQSFQHFSTKPPYQHFGKSNSKLQYKGNINFQYTLKNVCCYVRVIYTRPYLRSRGSNHGQQTQELRILQKKKISGKFLLRF